MQIRRAELVDTDVREAIAQKICDSSECADLVRDFWGTGRGDLIGRLRSEGGNILYVAAYMSKLREAAPEGSSWMAVYGTTFDPELGSYNGDPKFAAGFQAAASYYSYLDAM